MSLPTITVADRRARIARRHCLVPASRAATFRDVCQSVVGVHSSDPVSVFLAGFARLRDPEIESIERELYVDRTVVRILGMRRTMFVVPVALAPVVHAACTRTIAARERRRLVQFLELAGVEAASEWLREVEEAGHAALIARGLAGTADLYPDEPRLARKLLLAAGRSYEANVTVGTRVLPLLAAEGRIVRARPRGTWISSQYRWMPIEAVVPGGIDGRSPEEAQAELVGAWLASYGPGTTGDLTWWSGLTVREVMRALAFSRAVEVSLEDARRGWVLPDDVETEASSAWSGPPWVALLPALDSTTMGWKDREWYLGAHRGALFDVNGNAGPTVWSDGRVVGGWVQRRDGDIAVRLLEPVGSEAAAAIRAEAERLRRWLGDVRFTPRFRTPLERELAG